VAASELDQARMLYAQAQRMLEQAQRISGRTTEGKIVSQALWCDAGEHAFSGRDPKSERWDRTMKNEKGETVTVPWDVCGACLEGVVPGFNLHERHQIMQGNYPAYAPAPAAPPAVPQDRQ
jgi:hypothetical protein